MKYKVAICEDEQIFIDDIVEKIQKVYTEFEIETFHSGEELIETKLDFDILFLDIEMGEMNGIETALKLREMKYEGLIIFLTSHTEFMPEAFKVETFRFLNKPVEESKLNEALEAAHKKLCTKYLIIEEYEGNSIIKVSDIVYLEAYGDGTYIFDIHRNTYTTKNTLKYWKEQLNEEEFYQIHKSIIVSFAHIVKAVQDGGAIVKNYSEKLPISRRNTTAFKKAYNEYIMKKVRSRRGD